MALDIHNYELKYRQAEQQVQQSTLSDKNKKLILEYRDTNLLKNVCGKVRLIRVMGVLVLLGRHLQKDFDLVTKQDVEGLLRTLVARNPPYSAETLATYKIMIKNFFTWVFVPDRFPTTTNLPDQVAWITAHVRRRDKKKLQRNDLLTPEDIQRLLDICHNPRDKALIAILWESGGRVAEIGNLQLQQIVKTQHGYTLDLSGKTGQRTPLIVSSAPYLTQWLNNHPFKNQPQSPLWVHYQYETTPKLLRYDTIRNLLRRYFQRAGISKPFHPHIFRHSRATFVLGNNIMNESQAKTYFGWTPDSDMLATYSHLTTADANEAILKEHHLSTANAPAQELTPAKCPICGDLNTQASDYCNRCGAVLNLKQAYEHQQAHKLKEEVFLNLFKLLVEKGLIDEAAKEVHEAGLGDTLRRLAEHAKGQSLNRLPTPAPTQSGTPQAVPATPP